MATRRTRIVCISDTHNQTPRLPPGDILIHAGDLSNQGTYTELSKTVEWIKQSNFKLKIIVCGNHDITCDEDFYHQYGGYFHNKRVEDPRQCIGLFTSDPSIVYLNHESKQVIIKHEDGKLSKLNVFGSPYSPANGFWAFGYPPESASRLWDQVPLDSDIVITHTPAKFHRDECSKRGTAGCETLRQTLWRVRPRLFVCGHIHESYGVEIITWDLSSPNVKFKESEVRTFNDPEPGSKKQFTIDLSSKAKSLSLKNDGSHGDLVPTTELPGTRIADLDGPSDGLMMSERQHEAPAKTPKNPVPQKDENAAAKGYAETAPLPKIPRPSSPPFPDFEKADQVTVSLPEVPSNDHLGIRGQGGSASSPRCDQEAIPGREGRIETCVVNAAFMGSNYQHRSGKRFHKPIVIDLDLPIFEGTDDHRPME